MIVLPWPGSTSLAAGAVAIVDLPWSGCSGPPPAAGHAPQTAGRPSSYPGPDEPREGAHGMDPERRPENLLGVLLAAYWTSLAHAPLPALLLTGLLSLAGVLVVLLGHIVGDLVGQLVRFLAWAVRSRPLPGWPRPRRPARSPSR